MKFIVSDTLDGSRSFGKWKYSHDDKVKVWANNERVCLWFGYGIDKDLEEVIATDPVYLKHLNGKFCVVILWQDRLQVCLDYFSQTKIYYDTRQGLTVTNRLPLLPLKESDIDQDVVDQFMTGLGDGVPLYACKDPTNMEFIYKWNEFSHDHTVFTGIKSIPRDYWLLHDKNVTTLTKMHATKENNRDCFQKNIKRSKSEIEEMIHECMTQHSEIIKKNFTTIHSSISEGIDSTLQDQYFDPGLRLMYHPTEPNTIDELPPKRDIIDQYRKVNKEVKFDIFDVTNIGAMTDANTTDPMLSWVDTIPTLWQLNSLKTKPDVLMYGSFADEMFMHVPKFLFARIPPPHRYRYENSYGGRKSPARKFVDPYNGQMPGDWLEKFADLSVPSRYGRDIETQTGVFTASIYADKRIFNLIHSSTVDTQIDSAAHVGLQKRILRDRFNFEFKTAFKDGAGYECRMVVKHLLINTVQSCLPDQFI